MTCDGHRERDPRRRSVVATLEAAAAMAAAGRCRAVAQDVELVIDVATGAKGYRARRLTGQDVVNDLRERLGTIDAAARTAACSLRIGAVGGLRGHLVAVPSIASS